MTTRPATTSPAPDPSAEPFGSITDVDGVGVGHHQRLGRGWQTGTTVVACGGGATPGCDVRGGGPGTRETDALRPENLVDRIHAVCLTGGSAFGLAAADGVMDELEGRGLGVPVGGDVVVPVVPTAVVFDLGRGGDHRNRPDATFGRRAAAAALGGRATMRWGAVGAGAGARSGAVQGGVGTASTTVRVEIPAGAAPVAGVESDSAPEHLADGVTFTVGALAVVNSHGSVIDPATVLPWERGPLRWPRPGAAARRALADAESSRSAGTLNTTIGVVATDARLDKAAANRLASVAHDGLARAVRPAHALVDGDTVFALATGGVDWPAPAKIPVIDALLGAAADVFALACTHAVTSAITVGAAPSWAEVAADR